MKPPRPPRSSDAGTLAALLALMAAAIGLVALTAFVMPQALGFVAVIAAIFLFVAFHYLVWGWWLQRLRRDEDEWPDADQ